MSFSKGFSASTPGSLQGIGARGKRILVLLVLVLCLGVPKVHAISGGITSNATWSGSVLIEGWVYVDNGVTLTISPGTIVRFNDEGSYLNVDNGAALVANGTAGSPITFTSSEGLPAPGDWRQVTAKEGSTASFQYCIFEYGGYWDEGMLHVNDSDVTVTNCTFRHSLQSGVQVSMSLAPHGITPSLSNLTVTDCVNAAIYQSNANISPTYASMNFSGNGRDTVYINASASHITTDVTWGLLGTPMEVDGWLEIASGGSLTINPGVEVQFSDDGTYFNIADGGTWTSNGTVGQPITFTSAQDTPAPGDWRQITAAEGCTASFQQCVFEYGGAWDEGMLHVNATDVTVNNCTFSHSLQSGVQVGMGLAPHGITPSLSNLTVTDCTNAAIYQNNPNMSPTYSNMNFSGNGRDTLYIRADAGHINTDVTYGLVGTPIEVQGGLNVDTGGSLTIKPGVEVQFTDGNTYLKVNSGATLSAQGTSGNPVLFTSAQSTPAPGDWRQVTCDDGCTAVLRHCIFEYGGAWDPGMVHVYSSDTLMQHCEVRRSAQAGIQLTRRGSTPTFYDITVTDCVDAAIYQDSGDMSPSYAALDLRDNGHDTVYINAGSAHVLTNVTWALQGAPFEIDGILTIEDGGVVNVEPGVEVQFSDDGCMISLYADGTLIAEGTPSQHVLFTSAQDVPAPGDWSRISVNQTGVATFRYCTLEYGGYGGQGAIYVYSPNVTFDSCIIRYSLSQGIRVASGYAPTLSNNSIFDNATYGIYNNSLGKIPVDARYTWWGDATGPYHETSNPGGLGNAVSDGVLFDPWRMGSTEDPDGDGLTNAHEGALGTNPYHPDSDGDGLPDGYEVAHGLNPQLQSDGFVDTDEDGLSNIEEFLRNTDPNDANDPARVYYAATGGVDEPGRGTQGAPWRTIGYSLAQMSSSEGDPAALLIDEGSYVEDVNLDPGVTVRSRQGGSVTVEGTILGANGASVRNLSITSGGAVTLLDMNAVAMQVRGVTFSGENATGIVAQGTQPGASVVENCSFNNLSLGMDLHGSIPIIRKSVFDYVANGILIRATSAKQDGSDLGDAADPNSGYNTFGEVTGFAVTNERGTALLMENNDWETDDPLEVAAKIDGLGDYEPYLGAGTGVTSGSLACVVLDFHTEDPLVDATVAVDSVAVSENDEGVYLLSGLVPDTYTVTVSATDYEAQSEEIKIGEGLDVSLNFSLRSTDPALQADVNMDRATNAIDVQYVINGALELPVEHDCDLNNDEDTNAIDVQLVINAALGLIR